MKSSGKSNLGKVFSFTLTQHFKSKAAVISLIFLGVIALASMPVMALFFSSGAKSSSPVKAVRIINDTPYAVTAEAVAAADPTFTGIEEALTDGAAELGAEVTISENDRGDLEVSARRGGLSDISEDELRSLADAVAAAARDAMAADAGVDYGSWAFGAMRLEDYLNPREESKTTFGLSYMYSIFVMTLTIMSASYIIRSVVEEKSSRLVELLTVSVKPTDLLLGKIAAMACVVFSCLLGLAALAAISYFITSIFMDMSFVRDYLRSAGVSLAAGAGAVQIIVVVVSLVLAYAFFALVGGLSGACCTTQEDTGSAVLTVMLLAMAGYFGALILTALGIKAVTVAASLIPVLSAFVAPVAYISGDIGLGIVALSWVIQLAVLALLARFTASVYSSLIMHSGSRVKLKQLAGLAGKGAGA